jgi:RNA polymerase sigma-70 factor (ECF subfamily)
MSETRELEEHLFRREHVRIVAALTRRFGLALAEDVAQDAYCRALEVWRVHGLPDNPAAWLTTTAKRRAIDLVRRERTAERLAPETQSALEPAVEIDAAFEPSAIRDEQLRMMFACCQPRLAEEVQLALVLNILCGFGAAEIAGAFLATRAAIEKRIARGKHELAARRETLELAADEVPERVATVQRALYLLFSEGYHGTSAVRTELCAEAIRLVALLAELPAAATPATHALAALMCLHAARLPARVDADGELNAFADQDRARWDHALVAEGLAQFERSATGTALTAYHVEAAIAVVHASAASVERTDWAAIVELYDRLAQIAPSPVVALNRAIAVGRRDGAEHGLAELLAIADRDRLAHYPFYAAALGELELELGHVDAARGYFARAHALARNDAERRFLARRM